MHRRTFTGVLFLLAASLAFRLAFVSSDIHSLVSHGPLYDDSFYAFGVARHIAAGEGSTFDGEHRTNGYQPLWVGLLVPLYWLAPGEVPIYLALVLSATLNVLAGYLLYRLLRRRVSPTAALLGLVLWGFAPAIVRQAVNGLETSLALLLLLVAVAYYTERFRPHPSPGRAVTLGLVLGLAVLARVDALLLVPALAWDAWRRRLKAWRAWGLAALVSLAVLSPWIAANRAVLGRTAPESGEATRFLSAAYAVHDIPRLTASGRHGSLPLWAHNLGRSGLLLGTSPALHPLSRAFERGSDALGIPPARRTAGIVVLLVAALAVAAWLLGARRLLALWRQQGFLLVYAGLLVAAYSFVVYGHIFFSRYYTPLFALSIACACLVFDALLQRLPGRRRRGAVATAVLALYVVFLPYMAWNRLRSGDYRFINVVRWLESQTPAGARIGIFNSGAIGYFSDRHVVNLDGKVNHDALVALRHDDLQSYLVRERIDYVVDHSWILDHFLLPAEARGEVRCAPVADDSALGVPGWRAYRVTPLHAAYGGGTPGSSLGP